MLRPSEGKLSTEKFWSIEKHTWKAPLTNQTQTVTLIPLNKPVSPPTLGPLLPRTVMLLIHQCHVKLTVHQSCVRSPITFPSINECPVTISTVYFHFSDINQRRIMTWVHQHLITSTRQRRITLSTHSRCYVFNRSVTLLTHQNLLSSYSIFQPISHTLNATAKK